MAFHPNWSLEDWPVWIRSLSLWRPKFLERDSSESRKIKVKIFSSMFQHAPEARHKQCELEVYNSLGNMSTTNLGRICARAGQYKVLQCRSVLHRPSYYKNNSCVAHDTWNFGIKQVDKRQISTVNGSRCRRSLSLVHNSVVIAMLIVKCVEVVSSSIESVAVVIVQPRSQGLSSSLPPWSLSLAPGDGKKRDPGNEVGDREDQKVTFFLRLWRLWSDISRFDVIIGESEEWEKQTTNQH